MLLARFKAGEKIYSGILEEDRIRVITGTLFDSRLTAGSQAFNGRYFSANGIDGQC